MESLKKYRDVFKANSSGGIEMINSYMEKQRTDLGHKALDWWNTIRLDPQIITLEEIEAVDSYTGSRYNSINKYLCTGEISYGWMKERLDTVIKNLKRIIEKAPKIPPMTIWRGMGEKSGKKIDRIRIG